MRWMACLSALVVFGTTVAAQTRSVMIEDLTTNEVQAAIAAGKTTAIYFVGGAHQNGPDVAIGKHNFAASHVARRVAEELGNALVYPINPYAPAGDPILRTGHMRSAGTVSLTQETFSRIAKEVAVSALAVGFKNVVLLGDHFDGQETLEKIAAELNTEWSSKGARVFFIPVYAESRAAFEEQLTKMKVPSDFQFAVHDASEAMALARDNKWVRPEKSAPEVSKFTSYTLGQTFIDSKVNVALASIRNQVGK